MKNFSCRPGILTSIKKVLHGFIHSENSPLAKFGILSFDEMEVAHRYEYDQESDKIFGPFKKLQLAMVRGLFKKYKQPIYYDFDKQMKKDLLFHIIQNTEEAGVWVCGIVCDLGNYGLINSLGVSPDHPYFTNPADQSRKIFVFPDAPHLLKLCRNHLIREGYQINENNTIRREDLEKILEFDNNETRICPKLTSEHFDCEGSAKQKVRPAAQVLSHSVATALRLLFNDKQSQSEWVETINSWFDIFNSRMQFDANNLKCGFGIHLLEQKRELEKMVETTTKMRSMRHKNLLPFQKGILIGIKSLFMLYDELSQSHGVQYIRTVCLNQDILENFFSRIRAIGITDSHPGIK